MDEQERLKLSAVFTYLKELANLRYSGRLDLDRENHTNFSDFQPIGKGVRLWTPDSSKQNLLIQVEFLRRPDAPEIPNEVKNCINESKLSYREEPEIDYHCFEDPQKTEAIDKWLKDFHRWQEEMQHVRKVQEYYNKILSLYLTLSNTGYQKELVLGAMIFEAASNQAERIKYPLLTRRLTILKSVSVQENAVISIYLDEETQTEINPVPVAVCGLNSSPVTELQQAIKDLEINPLATEDIGLDKQFSELPAKISQNCRWAENSEKKRFSEDTQYVIYKDPVLLLRNKNTGLCETLDKVLADLQNGIADIPLSLKNIVCGGQGEKELDFEEPSMESKIAETAGEDEEILMVKPANREQLQVARAVKSNPAVVVQGPPGTGKTHTIANLLAHFLSEGKKVLVTSSSPNALSVLKDKLPESLQSLCVSATGDGKDMEKSITSLVNELAQSNRQMSYLRRNVESLKQSRKNVIERLKNVRKDIYSLRKREKEGEDSGVTYFKGKKYSIHGLARELYKTESLSTLIPGQVKTEDFPLTPEELTELYSTNGRWSEIDADYFREKAPLKNLDDVLLDSQQYELMVNGLLRLNDWLARSQIKAEKIFSSGKFQISFSNAVSEKNLLVCPEETCEELPKVWSGISLAELKQIAETPFLLFAVDAGRRNGADKEALEIFIKDLKVLDQLGNLKYVSGVLKYVT